MLSPVDIQKKVAAKFIGKNSITNVGLSEDGSEIIIYHTKYIDEFVRKPIEKVCDGLPVRYVCQ